MAELDMAEPALKYLTVDEFLQWDDGTDRRYELVDGAIVMMAPVQNAHAVIVGNFAAQANTRLKPPCRVYVESGVFLPHRNDAFYQADAAIGCKPVRPGEVGIVEPVVILEVLSPSTKNHDRGTKLPDYREIPSVQEILAVATESLKAELWRRSSHGWTVIDLGSESQLTLESIGISFPLASLYDGIDFSAAP